VKVCPVRRCSRQDRTTVPIRVKAQPAGGRSAAALGRAAKQAS
jgi:hypothetical protein